jgi:hypothetical protein
MAGTSARRLVAEYKAAGNRFFKKMVGRGRFRLFRQFWFGLDSNNFRYLHDTITCFGFFDQPSDGYFNGSRHPR